MKSRRSFLKSGSLAVAGTALFSKQLFAAANAKHITGLQLYSVRAEMMKDAAGTLKALSAMGYKYVEHANYMGRKFYKYSATDFKKLLDDLGLKMPSGHTVLSKRHWDTAKNDFTDDWKYTVEDAATVGQEYVISPWLEDEYRKTSDALKAYMEVFNKCGELCKSHGMKYGYHNHDFEFRDKLDGVLIYDIILNYTNPDLVIQQFDIGNPFGVGCNPLDVLKKYPGRFASMHVKDEIKAAGDKGEMEGGYESAVLGKGVVGVKEVVDYAKKHGGTRHFIIEQESYQGQAPLDSVKEDVQVMKGWGY